MSHRPFTGRNGRSSGFPETKLCRHLLHKDLQSSCLEHDVHPLKLSAAGSDRPPLSSVWRKFNKELNWIIGRWCLNHLHVFVLAYIWEKSRNLNERWTFPKLWVIFAVKKILYLRCHSSKRNPWNTDSIVADTFMPAYVGLCDYSAQKTNSSWRLRGFTKLLSFQYMRTWLFSTFMNWFERFLSANSPVIMALRRMMVWL